MFDNLVLLDQQAQGEQCNQRETGEQHRHFSRPQRDQAQLCPHGDPRGITPYRRTVSRIGLTALWPARDIVVTFGLRVHRGVHPR